MKTNSFLHKIQAIGNGKNDDCTRTEQENTPFRSEILVRW